MLLHEVAWRGARVSRCPVQEGSSLGVLLRRATWRAALVGRCPVLGRGRLALLQWGLSVVAGGRGEEGWGRWRGKAGVRGSRGALPSPSNASECKGVT